MRSFEERKNEILRRSDEIIQKEKLKRKKINRVIYTCVPCFAVLLITATVTGGYLSGLIGGADSNDISPSYDETAQFETANEHIDNMPMKDVSANQSPSASKRNSYIQISYSDSTSHNITDIKTVDSIIKLVESIGNKELQDAQIEKPFDSPAETESITDDSALSEGLLSAATSIYIKVFKDDGSVESYIYTAPTLKNIGTQDRFILHSQQQKELDRLINK